eukprot:1861029-Pyramimonas_sp.AAC.1
MIDSFVRWMSTRRAYNPNSRRRSSTRPPLDPLKTPSRPLNVSQPLHVPTPRARGFVDSAEACRGGTFFGPGVELFPPQVLSLVSPLGSGVEVPQLRGSDDVGEQGLRHRGSPAQE